LWVALAVRLPSRLPRALVPLLALCAVSFSGATGIDYVRLDRDRAEFTAGMAAVPQRATLLPLLFERRKTSHFTASLTHAWGYYTVTKNTSAPLVFAVERSYPISYRSFPPRELIAPALDRFAELHATPARLCESRDVPATSPSCSALWRQEWAGFWQLAEPRFGYLLCWAMPAEARALIPDRYRRVFSDGELAIYARTPGRESVSRPTSVPTAGLDPTGPLR
jgi:hypothetical protein